MLGRRIEIARLVVVVDIEYDIHSAFKRPFRHLLHAVKPLLTDGKIFAGNVIVPADRKTQRAKARIVKRLNHLFRGFHAAPEAFDIHLVATVAVVRRIKRIAQIPADVHVLHKCHRLILGNLKLENVFDFRDHHRFSFLGKARRTQTHKHYTKRCKEPFFSYSTHIFSFRTYLFAIISQTTQKGKD